MTAVMLVMLQHPFLMHTGHLAKVFIACWCAAAMAHTAAQACGRVAAV